jgi:hypothetical protein
MTSAKRTLDRATPMVHNVMKLTGLILRRFHG